MTPRHHDRLADLVPPPRKHRHRYHGVFAPQKGTAPFSFLQVHQPGLANRAATCSMNRVARSSVLHRSIGNSSKASYRY
ncbi:MAG: hypothetical protein EBT15_12485 [Betaproteobacteria bacterium]|nr:hypothetical protein [Betaproteobacteria bacterium]